MSADYSRGQATLAGMAQVASIRRPGDVAVVTGPAKTPFDDIRHLEVVAADAHFESEFGVAHLAAEADAMKPVGEYHRSHALLFRPAIENHIGILCGNRRRCSEQGQQQHQNQRKTGRATHLGGTAPAGIAIGSDGLTAWPGLATLWQRKHSVRGKDTAPWQTPHCSPSRIFNIEN